MPLSNVQRYLIFSKMRIVCLETKLSPQIQLRILCLKISFQPLYTGKVLKSGLSVPYTRIFRYSNVHYCHLSLYLSKQSRLESFVHTDFDRTISILNSEECKEQKSRMLWLNTQVKTCQSCYSQLKILQLIKYQVNNILQKFCNLFLSCRKLLLAT